MALQIAFTDAKSGAPLPAAYLHIDGLFVDTVAQRLTARMGVYYDQAAFAGGKAPVGMFDADLSSAYSTIYAAAPTSGDVGTAELPAARAYAVLHTLASVDAGGNTLDLTQATVVT